MNNLFTIDRRIATRAIYVMVAALMLIAGSPFLQPGHADAAQLATRSITLSDSGPSGGSITTGVGSGTAVKYKVKFTPANAADNVVIDFCTEDPIVNDTCTAPTSMGAATSVTNLSGTVGGAGWTLTASANQAKLTSTSGAIVGGTTQEFELNDITNPSTVGTFYARIYTYTAANYSTYHTPALDTANPSTTGVGTFADYGGIALSTARVITITARVQESLTFCVTASAHTNWSTNHDCSDTVVSANPPALTLGHELSPGGTKVLTNTVVDTNTAYSQLSTNATTGATVRMRNSNTSCGGLSADNGTTCAIPAVPTGNAGTPGLLPAGTAAFGLYVPAGTVGTTGTGTLTPSAAYNSSNDPTLYGMDTTTTGVTSTYGSAVASTAGPVYRAENSYVFAATSALTTPAGIYTANLSMIATGTF